MFKTIIIQSSDQINAQSEAAAAIAIFARQYPKDFQLSDDVFNHDALSCQLFVEPFLISRQFAAFRFFERRSGLLVQISQTLITGVRQTFGLFGQNAFTVFVKRKIVSCAFGKSRVNNSFAVNTRPDLRFYRVPFFLARIIAFLFFFVGRSISVSATSTRMTSMSAETSGSRLPGKVNSADFDKISSTLVMMRETLDSLIPQLVPKWNIVRYSRQYSSVKRTWSSITSFGFLPWRKKRLLDFWRTSSHILSKVSLSTPQYRLKLAADSFFNFSYSINECFYICLFTFLLQEVYYIDKDFTQKPKGITQVWDKVIMANEQFIVSLKEWNCSNKTFRDIRTVLYDRDGGVIESDNKPTAWQRFLPDSTGNFIFINVCEVDKNGKLTTNKYDDKIEKINFRFYSFAQITAEDVKLMSEADFDSKPICTLALGERLALISDEPDGMWIKVYDPRTGEQGWLNIFKMKIISPGKRAVNKKPVEKSESKGKQ